jgi:hypothetical protein
VVSTHQSAQAFSGTRLQSLSSTSSSWYYSTITVDEVNETHWSSIEQIGEHKRHRVWMPSAIAAEVDYERIGVGYFRHDIANGCLGRQAESEAKLGVEGTRSSGRTMVSTPLLLTQSAPIFVLRPNHSVDPEPKLCTSGYIDTRPSLA